MTPDTNPLRELEPCPFCGNALTSKRGQINPYAKCETEGCFGTRCPVVGLDVPTQVDAWNTRVASEPVVGTAQFLTALADCDVDLEEVEAALSAPAPAGREACCCRATLRKLVDLTWNHVTESQQVPSTSRADELIDAAFANTQPGATLPGRNEIARIIDPNFCFWDEEPPNSHQQRRAERALEKADAILALGATVSPQARGAARQFDDLKIAAETFRAAMITSGAINHVGQDQYFEELRALECALNPLNYRDATPPALGAADRERNLRRLVIAARAVCFDNQGPDALRALDKASEAFSELVAWENDPNDEIGPANTGETGR